MKTIFHNHKIAFAASLFAALPALGQISITQISPPTAYYGEGQLNDAGQVAFITSIGPYLHPAYELWKWTNGVAESVATPGEQAAGMPSGDYYSGFLTGGVGDMYMPFVLNDAGEIAFGAAVYVPGADGAGQGIWVGTPGDVQLVSSNFNYFTEFDSTGDVMVLNSSILLVGPSGTYSIMSKGDPAPGTNGLAFSQYANENDIYDPLHTPVLSADSIVGFTASTSEPGVNQGLWEASRNGSVIPVTLPGQQAPGLAPGITLGSPSTIEMSPNGNAVFIDGLVGNGVTTSNGAGFFVYSNGSMHLMVRYGDPVPSLASSTFYGYMQNMQVNDPGEVALITDIQTPTYTGPALFRWHQDQLTTILYQGQIAPGFNGQSIFYTLPQMFLNDAGQIVFTADLAPAGTDLAPNNNPAPTTIATLWLVGEDNQPQLLLEAGVPVDIDGQMITFQDIDLLALNNNGLALISDPDAGGLYLITLPEPALAAMALLPIYFFRRARRSAA